MCQNQAGMTLSGDLIGTLRYMSPEQALARRALLDHRTDIYSLGVTLYELLTLQPAFDGRDRQELLRQIAWEEPRPPRHWNKALPAELETIVLKAMAKHPDERYATAQELANDLRRWLDDKAILAKRPTLLQRGRKWVRRHKELTWTAVMSAVVLLGTISVVAVLTTLWTRHQLHLTEKAQDEATGRLYRSLVQQARASRLSRRMGQRYESLKTLTEAVQMAREMKLPEQDFVELRNEAIACLALPDVRVAKEWKGWPSGSMTVDFDAALERYVRVDRQGMVSIRRVADDAELFHLSGFGPGDFGPGDFGSGGDTVPIFSPDGRFLLLGRGERAKVWKLADSEAIEFIPEQIGLVLGAVAFSPDSRQLALVRRDGSISLYDLSSGRPLQQLRSVPGGSRLAFDPQVRRLAINHPAGVRILDLATGSVLADLPQPSGCGCIAWHPDGKSVAVNGNDGIIHLWDVATRKPIARLKGSRSAGGDICFAFNHVGDLLASTCWDRVLRLWDTRTGRQLFSTQSLLRSLHFSPDDRLLAVSIDDNKLRLLQVALASGYRTLVREPLLDKGGYSVCAASPKDRLLAVGVTGGVGLWDLHSGAPLAFLELVRHAFVLFEPSGTLLTSGGEGLLRWPIQRDLAEPGMLRIGPPQKFQPSWPTDHVAASANGQALAFAGSTGGAVWHRNQPGLFVRLRFHYDARYIDVSPDGTWVATGSHFGTKVKISKARTGELVHELPVEESSDVRFSPDGRWLATTGGGRLWAVDSWREGPHLGRCTGMLAFSPDGKLVAVETGHGVVRLVDPDTGREYARLVDPNQDRAGCICFSPDGAQLVLTNGDSDSIHVWDLRLMREQLAKMGLDWDSPPYPQATEREDGKPLRVQVDLDDARSQKLALAKNNDAWQLATHAEAKSRDPLRAVELAKQAIELAPKEGYCWNTLGVAHYRAGNWMESIAALEKSRRRLSGRFEAFNTFFLAMAHWQRNDKEQARTFYHQALQWMEKNKEGLKKDRLHEEELRRFLRRSRESVGRERTEGVKAG